MFMARPIPSSKVITGLPADLTAVAAEIHQSNIRAGWWKQDEVTGRTLNRNIGELLCLVHSEISEADEGYCRDLFDDKLPHRKMIEVELADTAIRALDILGFYGTDVEVTFQDLQQCVQVQADWPFWCRRMHGAVSTAMERFRKGDHAGGCGALVVVLDLINDIAISLELDVTGAINEKRAYNAQRADHKLEARAAVGGKQF